MKTSKMMSSRIGLAALLPVMAVSLSSCGGGGSSPAPSPAPPPPSNSAPQFTSASAVSVAENSAGGLLTVSASDADGDAVTLSISGGADAALFDLTGSQLSFTDSPNFDAYADTDEDNVFELIVQASDGRGGVTSQQIAVTVTNEREGISVRRVATGFDRPAGLSLFFSATMLIAEQDGTIWSIDPVAGTQQVFVELNLPANRELVDIASDVIGGTILAPSVLIQDSSGIHLIANLAGGNTNEIAVASGDPDGARGTIGYATGNAVGINGALIIAIGDPGGQRAQTPGGYGSASFIPIPDSTNTAGDIVPLATGLRQPSGIFNFGDEFFLGDQGGSEEHEINLVQQGGGLFNFGWPFVEGTVTVSSGAPAGLIAPSFVYGVGTSPLSGEGIVGGIWMQGGAVTPDSLLVGDESGKIFTFGLINSVPQFENRSTDLTPDVGSIDQIVDIAQDASGRVYILDADGELFVIEKV